MSSFHLVFVVSFTNWLISCDFNQPFAVVIYHYSSSLHVLKSTGSSTYSPSRYDYQCIVSSILAGSSFICWVTLFHQISNALTVSRFAGFRKDSYRGNIVWFASTLRKEYIHRAVSMVPQGGDSDKLQSCSLIFRMRCKDTIHNYYAKLNMNKVCSDLRLFVMLYPCLRDHLASYHRVSPKLLNFLKLISTNSAPNYYNSPFTKASPNIFDSKFCQ